MTHHGIFKIKFQIQAKWFGGERLHLLSLILDLRLCFAPCEWTTQTRRGGITGLCDAVGSGTGTQMPLTSVVEDKKPDYCAAYWAFPKQSVLLASINDVSSRKVSVHSSFGKLIYLPR